MCLCQRLKVCPPKVKKIFYLSGIQTASLTSDFPDYGFLTNLIK